MCGIIGAVSEQNTVPLLIEGLKKLEYRGYDSSGIAIIDYHNNINRLRRVGKVSKLATSLETHPISGHIGIAHTRWATHGDPCEKNAHPHISGERFAVVHNGIMENYLSFKKNLENQGYLLSSDTDTEIIAHLIHYYTTQHKLSLIEAIQKIQQEATGTYSFALLDSLNPQKIVVCHGGSPLVLGYGANIHFIASDPVALTPITNRIAFLEDGDIAELTASYVKIYDKKKKLTPRTQLKQNELQQTKEKGDYSYFMLQEIHEQPQAIRNTLNRYLVNNQLDFSLVGPSASTVFEQAQAIQIIACGTSYHAGMIAKYWIEDIVGIPCSVEIASEYRYRTYFTPKNCLFISISQSGETADTLTALKKAKKDPYIGYLSVCNVENSSIVRTSNLSIITQAGVEIGVASTKSFTTQLVAMLLITHSLATSQNVNTKKTEQIIPALQTLPGYIQSLFTIDSKIQSIAQDFLDKQHCLFLGRRLQYPVAMEGALKLKEISYIHAEAYAAGELKHGPLALVTHGMPIVVTVPMDNLLEKMLS